MNLKQKIAAKQNERAAKARSKAALGERYRQWLEDDGLGEVFDELRSQYLDRAAKHSTRRPEKAVRLLQAADIVDMVRSHIDLMMTGGLVAKSEIKEIVKLQTGKKREFF